MTSFLDHVYLRCTQRECKSNEITTDQYTLMFESRFFLEQYRKINWYETSSKNCCVVIRDGTTCEIVGWKILWDDKEYDRAVVQVSTPYFDNHNFKKKEQDKYPTVCKVYSQNNWNYVRNDVVKRGQWTVVKSRKGKKVHADRKVKECCQLKAIGQCSKKDSCSFSQDLTSKKKTRSETRKTDGEIRSKRTRDRIPDRNSFGDKKKVRIRHVIIDILPCVLIIRLNPDASMTKNMPIPTRWGWCEVLQKVEEKWCERFSCLVKRVLYNWDTCLVILNQGNLFYGMKENWDQIAWISRTTRVITSKFGKKKSRSRAHPERHQVYGEDIRRNLAQRKIRPQSSMGLDEKWQKLKIRTSYILLSYWSQNNVDVHFKISWGTRIRDWLQSIIALCWRKTFRLRRNGHSTEIQRCDHGPTEKCKQARKNTYTCAILISSWQCNYSMTRLPLYHLEKKKNSCEENGFAHEWTSDKHSRFTKHGKKFLSKTEILYLLLSRDFRVHPLHRHRRTRGYGRRRSSFSSLIITVVRVHCVMTETAWVSFSFVCVLTLGEEMTIILLVSGPLTLDHCPIAFHWRHSPTFLSTQTFHPFWLLVTASFRTLKFRVLMFWSIWRLTLVFKLEQLDDSLFSWQDFF